MLNAISKPAGRARFLPVLMLLVPLLMGAGPAAAGWENGDWATVFVPTDTATKTVCEDGQGGTIVAMYDDDAPLLRIWVSRLDHNGTEVWGDGGVFVPFVVGSDEQSGPIDVVNDGSGGAYCAYQEIWGTQHLLRLVHFENDGTFDWNVPVADFHYQGGALGLRVVATGDGEAILVWTDDPVDTLEPEILMAARVDGTGSVSWSVDVNQDIDLFQNPTPSYWDVAPDGTGGVLVGWNAYEIAPGLQSKIQRISTGGVVLWGSDGHIISGWANGPRVLPDGSGGAYTVMTLGWGATYGQHLDSNGNETWISGGILLQDANTWPVPCQFDVCVAGGALHLVQGVEDLYVQRADIYGSLLWGANGMAITSLAGWQDGASITRDAFGGVLVAYLDHYYSQVTDPNARALSVVRLDAFGTKLFEKLGVWFCDLPSDRAATDVEMVTDGSGGGHLVWLEGTGTWSYNEVYAMGVGPTGEAPKPTLTVMAPDAGAPEDVLFVEVLGDYLDASQGFTLTRTGSPSVAITGKTAISHQHITGTIDLTGADLGAYDLVVDEGGTPADTLQYAFGVGEPPLCEGDFPLDTAGAAPVQDESVRKVAFDSAGNAHLIWVEYEAGHYSLIYGRRAATGWEVAPFPLLATSSAVLTPCLDLGPDDSIHIAYIEDWGGSRPLVYLSYTPEMMPDVSDALDNGQVKSRPTIVFGQDGLAQFVYEEGPDGNKVLYHVSHNGGSFTVPSDIGAGTNGREPDLVETGPGEMALTYVRNSWFPGINEVCYQLYSGSAWGAAVSMYFGIYVSSPSVAWDGGNRVLFAWILDNLGTAPLLHTCLLDGATLGVVRWRPGEDQVTRTIVAGSGPNLFHLLTVENPGAFPMMVNLRAGDGNVFYPKRRLNSHDDVDLPAFGARLGGGGLFAFWHDFLDPGEPLYAWECYGGATAVGEGETPAFFAGPIAFPNPFNPVTTISFSLPAAGRVRLDIHDLRGRRVRSLLSEDRQAGEQRVVWDGRDGQGQSVASGVYFARLEFGGMVQARKLLLAK